MALKSDSCGIFRIGPCKGVKMCYGAGTLGVTQTALPDNCKIVTRIVHENGKEKDLGPHPIESHSGGQGYAIKSFRPDHPGRRRKLIENSLTPALQWDALAQQDMARLTLNREYFPFGVDGTMGQYSWDLPMDKQSKQKPCDFSLFDPEETLFKRGAHCPLMCFIGKSSDGRRSTGALKLRGEKADKRGWTHERRQKTKQFSNWQSSTSQWSSSEWSSSEWNGARSSS